MSVQSEITRIKNARDNSFTQVAAKGVTVPSGADIEDLPGLIQAIQQGGGIELPETIVAGYTPVMFAVGTASVTASSLTATGVKITVPKAGTYRFISRAVRFSSSGASHQAQLYKNGTAVSGTLASFASGNYSLAIEYNVQCAAGDTVEVYLKARSGSYPTACYFLIACIDWNNGWTGDLIQFTVGSTKYYADNGMTWGDWVDSIYNPNEEFEYRANTQTAGSNEGIYQISSEKRVKDGSTHPKKATAIISDYTYTLG